MGMIKRSVKHSVIMAGSAVMFFVSAAAHAQSGEASSAPAGSITDMTVFQVKPERADDFMKAMRANIAHSRTEDGNVSFNVYSANTGAALTVYVLETWKNADVQKTHSKQPTLVALHKTFATDLVTHPQSSAVQAINP